MLASLQGLKAPNRGPPDPVSKLWPQHISAAVHPSLKFHYKHDHSDWVHPKHRCNNFRPYAKDAWGQRSLHRLGRCIGWIHFTRCLGLSEMQASTMKRELLILSDIAALMHLTFCSVPVMGCFMLPYLQTQLSTDIWNSN